MPIGRPTKYDPKYCEMLVEHMASGLSFDAFAGDVNVAISTIYEWEKAHTAFSEAKKLGFSKNLSWWEKQGSMGLWQDREGPQFNTTNFVFQMKNRHRWRNAHDVEIQQEPEKEKLKKMSTPDLEKLVKEIIDERNI